MSNEEKMDQVQQPEKKMTHYDEKMARRAAQKAKDERDAKLFNIVGILIVIGLVALIASFPIRNYLAVYGTACTIDGEKFSNVEFNYYKNIISSNYLSQYGDYLAAYTGFNKSGDMTKQMYDEDLTYDQYFEKITVDHLQEVVALRKEMAARGYTSDVSKEFQRYQENLEKTAKENNIKIADYIANAFGEYATESNVEPFVKESFLQSNFRDLLTEERRASDEDVENYYNEHKNNYDLVDFRIINVEAQLPDAPTELADEGATVAEDGSYTPSTAEVEKAMDEAREKAQAAESTIDELGILSEDIDMDSSNYLCTTWLFDETRKPGDFTVIDNTYSNLCYAIKFLGRKINDADTYDLRVINTAEDNGADLVAEYQANPTEEKFIEMVVKYSSNANAIAAEGLYEAQTVKGLDEELEAWVSDSARKEGDVASFYLEDNGTFVLYYIKNTGAKYQADIRYTLTSENVENYIDSLQENMEVVGKFKFIEVEKAKKEAEEAAAAESTEDSAESTTDSAEETKAAE